MYIYPILPLFGETAKKKTDRWNKIAKIAAQQCGRGIIPRVDPPLPFSEAIAALKNSSCLKLICYEGEEERTVKHALQNAKTPSELYFAVGAEGGFERSEVEEAKSAGFIPVGLGKRILRCETAPLSVLSQIVYEYEL